MAGCRDECCAAAHSRYQKRARLRVLEEGPQIVSSERAVKRLEWWAERGVGLDAVRIAAGLGYGTLAEHVAGERHECLRSTERAILAVTWQMLPPSTLVYAGMTQRRVFSMMASGHTLAWITSQIGGGLPIGGAWRKQERFSLSLARAIADLAVAAPTTGPSTISATKVRSRGHLPLVAWDDPGTPAEPRDWQPANPDESVVDDVVVERLLSGFRVPSTRAEKEETMRRHLAAGGSERDLCLRHGWKTGRYVVRQDGAA